MSIPINHQHPKSWIPTTFAWSRSDDIFGVTVSVDDPDLVEFIAAGERTFEIHRNKANTEFIASVYGHESLRCQLKLLLWAMFQHSVDCDDGLVRLKVHCMGVYSLPGGKELLVLVSGWNVQPSVTWLNENVRLHASKLLKEHEAEVAAFDKEIELKKNSNQEFLASHPEMEKYRGGLEVAIAMNQPRRMPLLVDKSLLSELPIAITFPIAKKQGISVVEKKAATAIADSGWPSARNADYVGLLGLQLNGRRMGMVTWEPYSGQPSYPEIRWAVQKRLPAALRKPRSPQIGKPLFDNISHPVDESAQIQDFDFEPDAMKNALNELQLDQNNYRDRIKEIQQDRQKNGFEAIAWFQPYHTYSEDAWGICFDARKLDDFALSIWEDFKSQQVHCSHAHAAMLAFGLTYAHELFHAKVEAALSWLEINTQQPRYLRYNDRVYQTLRETPGWLEEALANWSAWSWFHSPEVHALFVRAAQRPDGWNRVVEGVLDLAPAGYQEWRLGHQLGAWRVFANQLATGKAKITTTGFGLPLESILTGLLPYDFQSADIPLRFVGSGVIADRLQSHPASFNVPARRELERALKYFRHSLDVSGGKGGHQKWTGPDQRAFILPTRDPVSRCVFHSFLHHVGIDKSTYVHQVRPNL